MAVPGLTTPLHSRWSQLAAVAAGPLLAFASPAELLAQGVSSDPPRALMTRPAEVAADAAADLAAVDACGGADVCYDLAVRYVNAQVRNPAIALGQPGDYDNVRLRGYEGATVEPAGAPDGAAQEIVAPTVEIRPGDSFRLTLHNELPPFEEMELPGRDEEGNPLVCADDATDHNETHCSHFNLTNMHTHGLWVSPQGNGDNVLLTINPGVSFTYEYNIPSDHPAGTFWYHAHRHGSTAPQLASGMAGALIIRGDRQPQLVGATLQHGDIDVILPRPVDQQEAPESTAGTDPTFREKVMLFQQIAYACRDEDGAIKHANPDGTGTWHCDPDDVGMLEPGPGNAFDQIGLTSWRDPGRHTSINGTVKKEIEPNAVAGEVERWRLIHGGVREPIRRRLQKATEGVGAEQLNARLDEAIPYAAQAELVEEVCGGDPLPVLGLATDGLTRPTLDPRSETYLNPAYREDILVSFTEPGIYCVVDGEVAPEEGINLEPSDPALLGFIRVDPAETPVAEADPQARILAQLAQSIEANINEQVYVERALDDLEADMGLRLFVKHQDIARDEVTGRQTVGFNIQFPAFMIGEIDSNFFDGGESFELVNAKTYDPAVLDRVLALGGVDEWFLTSFGGGGHPFHIHVNPFQIVSIRKYQPDDVHPGIDPADPATWVDVSVRSPGNASQYAGLQGTWKDTLFTLPGHLLEVRTRYERYIGDFVIHCHILDHEDQGMMQNVRIALTDGRGGFDRPMTEHAGTH